MAKLLYNDRLAPITSTLGFLECDPETAASTFYEWHTHLCIPEGQSLKMENITEVALEQVLLHLLPLTSAAHLKYLFVPTQGKWTAYFDNGWRGGDPSSVVSYLAEKIHCLGIRAVWVPNTLKGRKGRLGAVIFEVYDQPDPILNIKRSVGLVNEGNWKNKWTFETHGTPFPFEQVQRYKARRKTERFTPEMLEAYLKAMGIDAFSEDFYLATKECPAKLVSIGGKLPPGIIEYSLDEARKDY